MIKTFLIILLLSTAIFSFSQTIDNIKLKETEIPAGYEKSAELRCATTYAQMFYEQTPMYESFLGKVINKEFQSYNKKGDDGAILYFEFEKPFKGRIFLDGLLWGQNKKPTKLTPDEYYVKDKILIIWSFNLKDNLKELSKEKVGKLSSPQNEILQNKTVVIDENTSKNFAAAGYKFMEGDYKGCIPLYKTLLTDTSLSKTYWYVTVDNLGMAYGITGSLESAKQIFDYGLSKDSTYPMFYYNLACTYAEKNDMATCIGYLKKASKYKQNMLVGEPFPTPSTDDSFKRFMDNQTFLAALKEL